MHYASEHHVFQRRSLYDVTTTSGDRASESCSTDGNFLSMSICFDACNLAVLPRLTHFQRERKDLFSKALGLMTSVNAAAVFWN